jgi:competence protein ComEC
LTGLVDGIAIDQVFWGEPPAARKISLPEPNTSCHTAPSWQWDEVTFQFLAWPSSSEAKANNQSCVLLVKYANQTLLLPGDIDQTIERQLLDSGELPAADITLLLAAHHGSRTSSSSVFVNYVQAERVVYSAGYRNQHGHPHPDVVERFEAVGSQAFNTSTSGALEFIWQPDKPLEVIEYRRKQRRYWHQ